MNAAAGSVGLVPMTQQEFEAFLERDIVQYAEEKVRAGYWTEAEALEKSRLENAQLLPEGLATPDHHLFTIQSAAGQAVGAVWLKADLASARPSGFIYDLEIYEPYRRRGYAQQAMLKLEDAARGLGLRQLGLHVFAHNEAAQSLYERLGYRVSSLNMLKDL